METQTFQFTSVNSALKWAKDHVQFESSELVSQAPWSVTYKLNGQTDSAILKLVPPALVHSPKTFPALAKRFPTNLPYVISRNEELGLLLLHNHGGRRLGHKSDVKQKQKLLKIYASIQSQATRQSELLELFPIVDLEKLISGFIDFLNSDKESENSLQEGAAYFIGRSRSQNYRRAFEARLDLLESAVFEARRLPATICHGDFRLKNASMLEDGRFVLGNWDDASIGPAGLELHAFFGNCATPISILGESANLNISRGVADERYCLKGYVDELVEGGYASEDELRRALTGAICAGSIKDLVWYGKFPNSDSKYRRRVRKILLARLSDLLDVCDLLALKKPEIALRCASDYEQNRREERSEALLRRHLQHDQNDADGYAQLARLLQKRGKQRSEVIDAFKQALELSPDDATLHADLGRALIESLGFKDGISHLRKALYLGATGKEIQAQLDSACLLRHFEQQAKRIEVVPNLPVSDSERESCEIRTESLTMALRLFKKYGFLQLDNIFDPNLINACREQFLREYKRYFAARSHKDALSIGSKRYQVTVAMKGSFNDSELYANPIIMQLMSTLLGPKFHLGCMVCATSLPGSKDQHLHKDHRALFTAGANDTPDYTPPFAITMMVPLVSLDELIGTTVVKKGSHLATRRESAAMPSQVPIVTVGSCYLMDLRLSHKGMGNKTENVRPIMNMVYQLPWFADNKNYQKQPPIRIPDDEFKKIPRNLKKLFEWTTQPGPDVNLK